MGILSIWLMEIILTLFKIKGFCIMKKLTLTALLLGALAPITTHAEDFNLMLVTDVGGIDDKSFNQGAWEGAQTWAEEIGNPEAINYLHSQDDSDYITNLTLATQSDVDLVYGIGFKMQPSMQEVAEANPEQNYAMIDSFVDLPNVASLNFADEQAAFLAGVVAAETTETGKVGFLGGVEGVVIDKFEAGFVAGVQAFDENIEVNIQYAGSFVDPSIGKTIASSMFATDVDVIFHASGPTGNGAFAEAKDLVAQDPSRNLWVIGVDSDQTEQGIVEIDGEERNINLTSTLKNTGNVLREFANQTMSEGFKGGDNWFDLSNDGVGLAKGQLSDELLKTVAGYKVKIVDGDIVVPDKPE